MSDYEHEDGEYMEEGEEEGGQALFSEEQPEDEEGEEPFSHDVEEHEEGEERHDDDAHEAEKEPAEQPLPPKKEWKGYVRIHLPSNASEGAAAPLKPARVYFAEHECPLWARYLVNDDVDYFEAVLSGKDVSDAVEEGEGDDEGGDEGEAVDEEEEGEDGEVDQHDPEGEDGEDGEEDNSSRHPPRAKKSKTATNQQHSDHPSAAELVPVEFDDDGHMIIADPFKGNVKFVFHQVFKSQPANRRRGLPTIPVDEEAAVEEGEGGASMADDLVFIATMLPKEESEEEDRAFNEANGISEGDEVPTVGPTTPYNLMARIMAIPKAPEQDEEGEEEDGEGGAAHHDDTNHEDEEGRDQLDSTTQGNEGSATAPNPAGAADDEHEAPPLEFKMDALTLAALFCPTAFRKALMRKDLPHTFFLEGWLEVYSQPVQGTTDQPMPEMASMIAHICTATVEAIEKKKNPDPLPRHAVDEDGNEVPPVVDAKHPPPPPVFVHLNENGLVSVPKLRVDLRWTFALEKKRSELTSALRHLRSRLLGTAQMLPAYPNVSTFTTPTLVQSFLEFLMAVPRSALVSWTRPKPEEEEDDIADLDSILVLADDEAAHSTPLSYMLGTVLLDLRTREARKKKNKSKELKLSAFAAHKAALCLRFLEKNTLYDPLLVPAYCPKEEGGADNNPLLHTVANGSKTSPRGHLADTSFAGSTHGGGNASSSNASSPNTAPWPASLRLYDSDLLALACAICGALDTFREMLTRKNNLPRAVDDTVGTYHLLFHSFPQLDRQCAVCLVDFSAEEVTSIPLLTKRSIVPAVECIEDVFGPVDKDDEYPTIFAEKYWQQLISDKSWLNLARTGCPSLYMRVQDEEVRMKALVEAITKEKVSGAYVIGMCKSSSGSPAASSSSSNEAIAALVSPAPSANERPPVPNMNARDVISPTTMYHAVTSCNVSVIVALSLKGVTTVRRPNGFFVKGGGCDEKPLIDALLDDDLRRREERANTPVAARSSEDLLATEEDVADGILSILTALVEAGQSLQGVLASGRRSVSSELAERYGKLNKYKQLMKLWAVKEHERGTDPTQKYGILRYIPASKIVGSPARTVRK